MIELPLDRLRSAASYSRDVAVENEHDVDALYRTYLPLLRRIAIRKFDVEVDEVDDLVQQVFITLIERSEPVEDVHGYLIGAICNASRQHIRRRIASRQRFCDQDICLAVPDTKFVDDVVRNLLLGSALAQLSPRCRETLRDFYCNDLSAATIATRDGTSAAYIGRLLYLCRRKAKLIFLEKARRA